MKVHINPLVLEMSEFQKMDGGLSFHCASNAFSTAMRTGVCAPALSRRHSMLRHADSTPKRLEFCSEIGTTPPPCFQLPGYFALSRTGKETGTRKRDQAYTL